MKAQSYLQKNSYSPKLIDKPPDPRLKACVVIPSFNEPHLMNAIHSLCNTNAIDGTVELLVVLNHPENADASIALLHQKQYVELSTLASQKLPDFLKIQLLPVQILPAKIAGVGLARKIGMDEAIRRFDQINSSGLIYNIDADCSCHADYFIKSGEYMMNKPQFDAAVFGFLHPEEDDPELNRAIMEYELHLRSYINWQLQADYPFAYQTLGSCFVVRTGAYIAQGGMNRRKAGEDFYFLHKFSSLQTLGNCADILVYPSGRVSNRVPFGTGKAVINLLTQYKSNSGQMMSYNPQGILAFCKFLNLIKEQYQSLINGISWEVYCENEILASYLKENSFGNDLAQVIQNCAGEQTYKPRVAKLFNPFNLMKFLHFAENKGMVKIPVMDSSRALLNALQLPASPAYISLKDHLNLLREFDQGKFKQEI